MSILIDNYDSSHYDGGLGLLNANGFTGISVAFFTPSAVTITSAKFYLAKLGSPTGNANAKLYAMTGVYGSSGKPTGTALATSDNFDVSTLSTSLGIKELFFTGAEQYQIAGNTHYCITIEYSGGDTSNRILVGADFSSPADESNSALRSGSAWSVSSFDYIFYVYGDLLYALPTTTNTPKQVIFQT